MKNEKDWIKILNDIPNREGYREDIEKFIQYVNENTPSLTMEKKNLKTFLCYQKDELVPGYVDEENGVITLCNGESTYIFKTNRIHLLSFKPIENDKIEINVNTNIINCLIITFIMKIEEGHRLAKFIYDSMIKIND